MKQFLKDWLFLSIILIIVTYGWQGLELLMIGHINSNKVDDVIGLILTVSLYWNLQSSKKYK